MYHLQKAVRRGLGVFLIFSFFVSPISVVFAEETVQETQQPSEAVTPLENSQTTAQTDSPVVPDAVIQNGDQTDAPPTDAPEAPNQPENLVPTPPIPPPEVGGGSSVKQVLPQPDPVTGALVYEYPITVPPGRNGMQPDLKVDHSATNAAKDVIYQYDDLYRLTKTIVANTANTQDYTETYSYDAVGNLLDKTGQAYAYDGNTGTDYANPHAATTIGSATLAYDENGNLLSDGTHTNVWNYRNQILSTTVGTTTLASLYDHEGFRVRTDNGTVITKYPTKYYNLAGTKKTKQIYAGDLLVATVETVPPKTNVYYVHTDPVLGSNVITDKVGAVNQLLDYYPFGDIRLNEQQTTFDEQKKFGGHLYDIDTDLNYLGARYYDAKIGKFISEDPSFLSLGDEQATKANTGQEMTKVLMDPQSLNSYSYTENNPLTKIDTNGRFISPIDAVLTLGFLAYDVYKIANGGFTKQNSASLSLDATGLVPFVPGIAGRLVKVGEVANDVSKVVEGAESSSQLLLNTQRGNMGIRVSGTLIV